MNISLKKRCGKASHWFEVMLLHVRIMEMAACNASDRAGTGASWAAICAASRAAKAVAETTSPTVTSGRAMNITPGQEIRFWSFRVYRCFFKCLGISSAQRKASFVPSISQSRCHNCPWYGGYHYRVLVFCRAV